MLRRPGPPFVVALGAALLLALATSACGDSGSSGSSSSTMAAGGRALEGTWILASYVQDDQPVPAATPAATLQFVAGGTIQGTTGCNSYRGTWTTAGPDELGLELGPMTMMACADQAVSAQEQVLTSGLSQVAGWDLEGDSLTLLDADGSVQFTFNRGAEGVVGDWKVTGVNDGNQAVVGTAATEALRIQFSPDGTVSGDNGCNTFSGPYTASGQQLTIGPLASTLRACADPEVDALAQQFLTALEKAVTWEQSGQTVTLRDSAGATQVVLVPAQ